MTYSLPDGTERGLLRLATDAQRASRTPALAAGIAHMGRLVWHAGVGTADIDDPSVPLGSDTQFLVASNTKTFTAVLIMQLRDEGKLSLDDTVDELLPGSSHPHVTVRRLLSHTSGMQREPVGDIFDTLELPDPARIVDDWNVAESVLRVGERWHYSNLAYMLLGEIVARLDGRPWADALRARLLDPLGLRRTGLALAAPHAGLYYLPPYSDVPVREPVIFEGAMAPAGGLASTLGDLASWHGFLLDPDAEILSPDTIEEMREPQAIADPEWRVGWGLGFELVRSDGRTWFGHTGGAPGGITGAFSHAESRITSLVLMNNTSSRDPIEIAVGLGGYVLANDPPAPEPWRAGTAVPPELEPLLGVWFSEGLPFVFSVREGRLEARAVGAAETVAPSVFVREADDAFRTVSGRERGERLLVRRHPDGTVRQLNWVTYRFTRQPLGFGERLS